ncbi:MAG: DUF1203 domain-containing protein [Xanthomonadales bacterium]|nr:DUF1203 domain-containing protein [Xanthomonadales bacterium]
MDSFRISGLAEHDFTPLFALGDDELGARHIERVTAVTSPGYPCRVSLVDAEVGEELLLLPFEHQHAASPYRASGPIFVRRGASLRQLPAGEIPPYVSTRLISLRAYNATHRMIHAEVCEGIAVAQSIARAFANAEIAYLHLHNAKQGCYSCRVDRISL